MRSRRPRLLWVNHFMVAPTESGGTRHFEMAQALAALGWDVLLVGSDFHLQQRTYTRRRDGDRRTVSESINGVEVRWLYSVPYRKNDLRRLVNWLSFAYHLLRERWGDTPPDVTIGSSPHLLAAWAAARVSARLKVPFVLEVRDLWPESMLATGRRPGLAYFALQLLAQHLYHRARKIIVLAKGSADYLVKRGQPAEKFSYVPNGVDLSYFEPVLRARRETFTLVYAGAHGPMNGLEVVLAAAVLLRHLPQVRFLLVGDGPAKGELVAAAKRARLENLEFRAPVPKDQIPGVLAQADAGLMVLRRAPIFSFGVSPNKLFDYLAAGLPVVCNVPGDVAGIVAAANAGVQARDHSAEALADAITSLAQQTYDVRQAMGASGRRWVEREHGRLELSGRLDTMLRELLKG